MSFLNLRRPILSCKQEALDYQDRQGLLTINLQIKNISLFSGFYTRIDQVFLLWGLICAAIFLTAQFSHLSWVSQAIFWSILTALGSLLMIIMTYFWVRVERLRWVLSLWVILMLGGVIVTDLGIFLGIGEILIHLCHIWLGLSAVGYLFTGLGMNSRAFMISSAIHLVGILLLPYCFSWQFLTTGLLMMANLIFLAETQWDMRSPIENYALLSEEQKQFNQQQQQLRQVS